MSSLFLENIPSAARWSTDRGVDPEADQKPDASPDLMPLLDPLRVARIAQIIDTRKVRLRASAVRKVLSNVDASVEVQAPIGVDVDVLQLVIGGRVDKANIAGLQEVIARNEVFLVGRHFHGVRARDGLVDVGIVETLGVGDIRDIEGRDVVACCVGVCCKLARVVECGWVRETYSRRTCRRR